MTAGLDAGHHAAELGIEFSLPKPFDPVVAVRTLDEFAIEDRWSNAS
jgi:hypothetical protein